MLNKQINAYFRRTYIFIFIFVFSCLNGCTGNEDEKVVDTKHLPQLNDGKATKETKALYQNLFALQGKHVLFGHQDDLAYGVNWINEDGRSDVKDTTGAYPAITGWEIGGLDIGDEANLDRVNFDEMKQWIKDVYQRGGINTISWHMFSPVNGKNSWSGGDTVRHLLPGGEYHEKFKTYLDTYVEFNKQLVVTNTDGEQVHIPIIFRPWHEHNGDWFWWSKGHTPEEDYKTLWRFTVEYLRDVNQQHNLIYAFSPDRSRMNLDNFRSDYLWGYPGDEYIDIIGFDNYHDLHHSENADELAQKLQNLTFSLEQVALIAKEKNKLAALSEGGSDGIANPRFWTDVLLESLNKNEDTRSISYVVVWRNANKEIEKRDHFYAPYPEHASADNFREFYNHPFVLFNDGLPSLYE